MTRHLSPTYNFKQLSWKSKVRDGAPGLEEEKEVLEGGHIIGTYQGIEVMFPNLRGVVANLTPNDKNETLPQNESSHDVRPAY